MNIILNIDINNVFQQHAFINTCMRIVASICVNITPNTSRNFIYSALPAKKKKKKKKKYFAGAAAAKKIVWTPEALLKVLEEMSI